MNRVEKLLTEMCPEGLEFQALSEVCSDFIVPMRDRPKVFDGDIPWCRIEDIEKDYIHGSLSGLKVSQKVISEMNLKVMPKGTVIASCSASLGRYAISTTPLITNQTFIGLVCGDALYNRFLLHILPLKTPELIASSNSGTIPYISRAKFERLQIPVPPLEIQHEIVRILDTFTELETELETQLEAELEARKTQYEYYRKHLLSFRNLEAGVRWIPLGELVANHDSRRKPVTRSARVQGDYPYYGANGIQDYVADFIFDGIFLLLGEDGSVINSDGTPVVNWATGKIWVNNHAHVLTSANENVDLRYLFHFLKSTNIREFVTGGSQLKINQGNMNRIPIALPALEEQIRVRTLLDQFEELTTELKNGLPAEIAGRREQYEYYRNKLLTFKELEVA